MKKDLGALGAVVTLDILNYRSPEQATVPEPSQTKRLTKGQTQGLFLAIIN